MSTPSQLSNSLAGRYTIDREIGRGGMATVFLARDVRHQRNVALKVLNPELGAVLGVERFLAEIQVTANLQHPNLLPLFDSGEADGLLFYVMPFVDGESLRARLEREKQLPVDEALRIATAVAGALDYAHRHGVIHRDLKPENILLHEGQPLVADFGIALAVSKAGGNRITQTGLSLGTPQYMSPEQATGDRAIDGRTDTYSLGAVLYEMLTGDPPHIGSTSQAVIARVLTEKPRSLRASREAVPHYVDAAVERALAKLPADRWPTARDFADALNTPRPAPAPGVEPTIPTQRSRLGLRARQSIVLILPVIGVAVGAAGVRLLKPRDTDRNTIRYVLNQAADERTGDAQGVPIAVSPDGKLLAYVARKSGHRALFVRRLGELEGRAVPVSEDAVQPFFSPDGKWIGFVSRSQLKKIPVDGGMPATIGEVPIVWGAHWYRDEEIVLSTGGALAAIPASGGRPRVFLAPDTTAGEASYRFPLVLRDGKTVLFASIPNGGPPTARIGSVRIDGSGKRIFDLPGTDPAGVFDGILVYASSLGAIMGVRFDETRPSPLGAPVPLVNDVLVGSGGPLKGAVSTSGTLAYLSGSAVQQMVVADPSGATRPLNIPPGRYARPRLSPDGRQLAIETSSAGAGDIAVFDFASGTLTPLTTDGRLNTNPEWSADGKRVMYRSMRDGRSDLWWQPVDHSAPAVRLVNGLRFAVVGAASSADGRTLVLPVNGAENPNDLWYRGLAGDTVMKPLIVSAFNETSPRLSPNGQWLAFSSDEPGIMQVYVMPFPGPGGRYQVTTEGGTTPVWSPDGRRLFYTHAQRLESATLRFAPTFAVVARDTLFDLGFLTQPGRANFDVTSDGKRFVFPKPLGEESQLIVVHDWKYEVRARLASQTRR